MKIHWYQKLKFLVRNGRRRKIKAPNLFYLFLGLSQDQQQEPAVHTGGVSRWKVSGYGGWR